MTEVQIANDFAESASRHLAERLEYDSMSVLLIYWKENDLHPDSELQDLRRLFEKKFNFTVTSFPIPPTKSEQRLNYQLAAFVADYCHASRSLIIVYYADHCFSSPKGEAQWAAFENGGPTLYWSASQQILYAALGDVLLVLDCCEAAIASRGSKSQGRFELLAASAKGVKTPEPGRKSFTSFLHRALSRNKENVITVRHLFKILREDEHIEETPFWADLAENSPTSITLQPLRPYVKQSFMKKPSSYLLLRASLTDDVSGLELADWLKTAPPDNVTAVNIEAVILRARNLQMQVDSNCFPTGSILKKLSPVVQTAILREFQALNTTMTHSTTNSRSAVTQSDEDAISEAYDSIQAAVSAVCSAVETPLLLDLNEDELDQALGDKGALAAGAEDAISLRQCLLRDSVITDSLELPRDRIKLMDGNARFRIGEIDKKVVLAEFFAYDEDPMTG